MASWRSGVHEHANVMLAIMAQLRSQVDRGHHNLCGCRMSVQVQAQVPIAGAVTESPSWPWICCSVLMRAARDQQYHWHNMASVQVQQCRMRAGAGDRGVTVGMLWRRYVALLTCCLWGLETCRGARGVRANRESTAVPVGWQGEVGGSKSGYARWRADARWAVAIPSLGVGPWGAWMHPIPRGWLSDGTALHSRGDTGSRGRCTQEPC